MIDERLKIAVFIDFDNIEIGVKTTLHTQFDIAAILDGIKERGEVVTKVAYGDWKRAGDYGRLLSQHAIRMVQRNLTPGGDKNGADINLALDALEMAFTHDHINAFVIVGGDSDFITLVEKLKQYDKKVFVVGGRQFTSLVMQKNCHEFIAYENLVGGRRPSVAGPGPKREGAAAPADVAKVIPLVKRALKVLADREVSPQLGLLKSTLLQLDSTFSERDYGVSTFRDFIEKIAKTGIITLRHSGRSMLVDAAEGMAEISDSGAGPQAVASPAAVASAAAASATEYPASAEVPAEFGQGPSPSDYPRSADPARSPAAAPVVRDAEQVQQIVDQTKEVFSRAAQPPRWPMYVRQLKQYIRGVDSNFDERKWGFGTVMDFLRVCQREGLFRLERDRRGQVRVFPGAALPRESAMPQVAASIEPEDMAPVLDGELQQESLRAARVDAPARMVADEAADEMIEAQPEMQQAAVPEPAASRAKPRRARRTPTPGKPAARKSTGAKAASPRRKAPASI